MQDVEVERTIVPAEQKEFDMSEVETFSLMAKPTKGGWAVGAAS
jgi:hypothetical protein